jgi:adenylate kinase
VVEHYRALGRFEEVDGAQAVSAVAAGVEAAVERLRSSGTKAAGTETKTK